MLLFFSPISTQLSSTTVFNTDNNQKCFIRIPSLYQSDFWRVMWHWRLEWWCWKCSFNHWNKWHFTIYSNAKQLFKIVMFHNIMHQLLSDSVAFRCGNVNWLGKTGSKIYMCVWLVFEIIVKTAIWCIITRTAQSKSLQYFM